MEGGNNLEQATALVAAANKVVQDPNSVGTALRTISLRLRGTSVKVLEEMGEETDGVIESVSKLQGKIKALSGVNILTDSGDYKDTYTILYEIGQVWEDMSDIDQAALLELMAGKNRANTLSAILSNMEDLEGAYNTALNAEGSAYRENEAYLDSIQGRIDLFNNSVQTLWMNALNSDVIKGFVDFGTTIVELIDKFGVLRAAIVGLFTYLSASSKFNFDLASMLGIHNMDDNFFKGFSTAFGKQGFTGAVNNWVAKLLGNKKNDFLIDVGDFASVISDNINNYVKIDTTDIDNAIEETQNKLMVARQQLEAARAKDWNYYKSLGSTSPAKDRDANINAKIQEIETLTEKLADLEKAKDTTISSAINDEVKKYESMLSILPEVQGKKLYLGNEQDAAVKIDAMSKAAQDGQLSLANYVSTLGDADVALKAYAASVQDGNYSLAGFQQFINQHNAGLKASSISAKLAAVGHQLLNAALSMGISFIASYAIQGITAFFDNMITTSKEAAEGAREAINAYQDSQKTLKDQKKTVESLSTSYAKLSTGVNPLNNENIGLTTESYQDYLGVCNDIAEMFPELVSGYDSEGNAILTLKGKIDLLTEAYENKNKAAAAQFLTPENQKNIWRTYNDTVNKDSFDWYDSRWEGSLDEKYKMLEALSSLTDAQLKELQEQYNYNEWGTNISQTGVAAYLKGLGYDFGDTGYQKLASLADEFGLAFNNIVEEITTGDGKVVSSTNDFRDNVAVALSNVNSKISSAMGDIKQTVSAKLLWNTDYQQLDDSQQQMINSIVNNLDPDAIAQMGAKSVDDVASSIISSMKNADQEIVDNIYTIQGDITKAIASGDTSGLDNAQDRLADLVPDDWRDKVTKEIVVDKDADIVTQFLQKTIKDIENQSKNYEAQLKFQYDYDNNSTVNKVLTDRVGEIAEDTKKEIENAIDGLNLGDSATIKDVFDKISKDLVGADDAE